MTKAALEGIFKSGIAGKEREDDGYRVYIGMGRSDGGRRCSRAEDRRYITLSADIPFFRGSRHSVCAQRSQIKERQSPRDGVGMALSRFIKLR